MSTAWINSARQMAYSACRLCSQNSLILLEILLGHLNTALCPPKFFDHSGHMYFPKYEMETPSAN